MERTVKGLDASIYPLLSNGEILERLTTSDGTMPAMLTRLKEFGVCVVPRFVKSDIVEKIRTECSERAEVPEDTNFEDGSYRRYDCYQGTGAAPNKRVYHIDYFSKAAREFRESELLKGLVANYYRDGDYSVHVQIYERHQNHEVPLRGFHIDTLETSTVKAFVYLGDVGEEDGPFTYIPYSHKDAKLRELKERTWGPSVSEGDPSMHPHPFNFSRRELGTLLERAIPLRAPKGSMIIADTWGIHCGTPVQCGGDRHVIVNYYRKGANLPHSDFGFDVAATFKRYAVDYKKFMPKN